MSPPPLPAQSTYTSCWCEENIYLLCQEFLGNNSVTRVWNTYTVFISNQSKTVALWKQKNAWSPFSAVVWDYHVVLLLTPRNADSQDQTWIYDFDTVLPMPCPAQDYLEDVFVTEVDERYYSLFRIVPGDVFIDNFASDRSHMLREGERNEYIPPPPGYPPIIGTLAAQRGVRTNLMSSFVCMERTEGTFGTVVDIGELKEWLGVTNVTE